MKICKEYGGITHGICPRPFNSHRYLEKLTSARFSGHFNHLQYSAKMMSPLILCCYPLYGEEYNVPSNDFVLGGGLLYFFESFLFNCADLKKDCYFFFDCRCSIARHHLHLIGIYLPSIFYIHGDNPLPLKQIMLQTCTQRPKVLAPRLHCQY